MTQWINLEKVYSFSNWNNFWSCSSWQYGFQTHTRLICCYKVALFHSVFSAQFSILCWVGDSQKAVSKITPRGGCLTSDVTPQYKISVKLQNDSPDCPDQYWSHECEFIFIKTSFSSNKMKNHLFYFCETLWGYKYSIFKMKFLQPILEFTQN